MALLNPLDVTYYFKSMDLKSPTIVRLEESDKCLECKTTTVQVLRAACQRGGRCLLDPVWIERTGGFNVQLALSAGDTFLCLLGGAHFVRGCCDNIN